MTAKPPANSGGDAGKATASFMTLFQVRRHLTGLKEGVPGRWLPVIMLILFAGVVIYYASPRPKSFFLDLTTDHLSVVTDADTQILWELPRAAICLPRHRVDVASYTGIATPEIPRCDADVYVEIVQEWIELDWPKGVELVLRPGPGRSVDVLVRFPDKVAPVRVGDVELVSESILNLPKQVFTEFGGLSLSGQLEAGQLAENGTLMMLRHGKYETRERFWFRNGARLVDSGAFSLGDVVSIERRGRGKPLSAYAFLTLAEGETGFRETGHSLRVIVSSEETSSRLRLDRVRANRSYLEPSWAQRLSKDPLVIGLATVLGLFGAVLALLNAMVRRRD